MLGLRVGDPNDEVLGAWLAKEGVRDVDLADNAADGAVLLDKTIAGCLADDEPEVEHYRLRVPLHTGGVTWPNRPCPPRIRTRSPHSFA